MLCPAKKGYTEEDYYFGEWTAAERENGEHLAVMKFVRPDPTQHSLDQGNCDDVQSKCDALVVLTSSHLLIGERRSTDMCAQCVPGQDLVPSGDGEAPDVACGKLVGAWAWQAMVVRAWIVSICSPPYQRLTPRALATGERVEVAARHAAVEGGSERSSC